jgi:hypothetical protein
MSHTFQGHDDRSSVNAFVGYGCLAIAGVMGAIVDVGWYDRLHVHSLVLMNATSLVLLAVGLLSYLNRQALDAVVFMVSGVANWTYQAAATIAIAAAPSGPQAAIEISLPADQPLSYQGWYFGCWALFFATAWIGARRSDPLRSLFVAGTALVHGLSAVACWWAIRFLQPVVGYLMLAVALVAIIVAAREAAALSRSEPSSR